ncbi:unnamed protein product, partial [Staurois parvus]
MGPPTDPGPSGSARVSKWPVRPWLWVYSARVPQWSVRPWQEMNGSDHPRLIFECWVGTSERKSHNNTSVSWISNHVWL